ncbi:hypothetical protein HN51_008086, partial [Arachis hypogaea]
PGLNQKHRSLNKEHRRRSQCLRCHWHSRHRCSHHKLLTFFSVLPSSLLPPEPLHRASNPNSKASSSRLQSYSITILACIKLMCVGGRKAVVIHVPFRLRKGFRKIHVRLVRELEKKFSGKCMVWIDVLIELLMDDKASIIDDALSFLTLLLGFSQGLKEIRNSRELVPLLIDLLRFGSVKGKENSITLILGFCKEETEVVARRFAGESKERAIASKFGCSWFIKS